MKHVSLLLHGSVPEIFHSNFLSLPIQRTRLCSLWDLRENFERARVYSFFLFFLGRGGGRGKRGIFWQRLDKNQQGHKSELFTTVRCTFHTPVVKSTHANKWKMILVQNRSQYYFRRIVYCDLACSFSCTSYVIYHFPHRSDA